jgi:hypothetical protein
MDATERSAPPDEVSDVTTGEMLREVLFFAIVVGAIAGGGYGVFAGYTDWHHAAQTAEKKSASVILWWGLLWAAGGAAAIALLCSAIAGVFLGTAGIVRRLVRR